MKKKVFRERYAENVVKVETFDKLIENPTVEVKPKKKRASKKKEA